MLSSFPCCADSPVIGAGAVLRVPCGGDRERGGAGEESLFGGGGVAAVDAAHELVEGISQAGLMPLAVVPVGDGGGLAAVRGEEIMVVGAVVGL